MEFWPRYRNATVGFCLVAFSAENRCPPRIASGAGFFRKMLLFSDVLVPQLGLLADEPRHQLDAARVVEVEHHDALADQQILVAGEIDRLADHHRRNLELDDGAGAHHARRQRGVDHRVAVAALAPGIAQAVHLAVRDRVGALDALIVPAADHLAAPHQHAADRQAALVVALERFVVGQREEARVIAHAGSPAQRYTSVHSSDGSGSGAVVANSAASLTMSRTPASIFFSSSSLASLFLSRRARTCSIGSCSVRTRSTSSRVRYLAGSDMEWPR